MSFYNLAKFASRFRAQYDALEWSEIKDRAFSFLSLCQKVTFGKGGTGTHLLGPGFSDPEEWGCWTDGSEAILYLMLPPTSSDLELVMEARPMVPQANRFAEVLFNEEKIARWDVGGESTKRFTALIKKSLIRPGHVSVIKLKFNKTFSPAGSGKSLDSRKLGLALEAMTLCEVSPGEGDRSDRAHRKFTDESASQIKGGEHHVPAPNE